MTIIRRNTMLRMAALSAALLAGAAAAGHAMPLQSPVSTPGQSGFHVSPEAAVPFSGRGVRPEQARREPPAFEFSARPSSRGPATVVTGGGRSVGVRRQAASGAAAGQ